MNVILIVIDTLRKDYAKHLEVELEKLGFLSYEKAIAPASWTAPSHASIFTGFYPINHDVHVTRDRKLQSFRIKPHICSLMLQNMLKNNGYTNYIFTANPYVTPFFGYKNFDYSSEFDYNRSLLLKLTYNELMRFKKLRKKSKLRTILNMFTKKELKLFSKVAIHHLLYKFWDTKMGSRILSFYRHLTNWPIEKGVSKFIDELESIKFQTPAFIFMNLMEVHEPYLLYDNFVNETISNLKGNKLNVKFIDKWRAKYAAQVEYVTNKILEIMHILINKEIFDKSLVIVTSDHGQLLGEYGRINHGIFLYDELLKVPLLIKYPTNRELQKTDAKGYISLTKIKSFIINVIKNKISDDKILYSDTIFAESYGIHLNIDEESVNPDERKNIEELNKYKIAIYHNDFKGIFNVQKWMFEEANTLKDEKINNDEIRFLKKEIIKFLNNATKLKVARLRVRI